MTLENTEKFLALQQLSLVSCISNDVLDLVFVFCGACEILLRTVFDTMRCARCIQVTVNVQ